MKKIKVIASIVITFAGLFMLVSAITGLQALKIIGYCGFIIYGILLIISSRK
ncbi:MAG: hypothetical protein IKH75_11300 [Ruminococcus sp.]|nr:hypothetical protein [Ruminococcus sp.]